MVTSFVGTYVEELGKSDDYEDAVGFEMRMLGFPRTFVEKLFALHGVVETHKGDGLRIARDARHYADLFVMAAHAEVRAILENDDYQLMCQDQHQLSQAFFGDHYVEPPEKGFSESAAFFPTGKLRRELSTAYDRDVGPLFLAGAAPRFDDILRRFEGLRRSLAFAAPLRS